MNKLTNTAAAATLIALTLSLTACSTPNTTPTNTTAPTTSAPSPKATPANKADYMVSIDLTKAPTVEINKNSGNVSDLLIETIVPGSGEGVVKPGDTVTVNYTGIAATSQKQFDSSWTRGKTATFALNQVIPGWTEGLVGMRVGERRLLIIPAEKAYGNTPPAGAGILKGETLIFVVDLVSIP